MIKGGKIMYVLLMLKSQRLSSVRVFASGPAVYELLLCHC